jgi:AsmA protein
MKKLVVTLLVLVALVIGAALSLPFLLSSDTMRQSFASKISAISGLDIALDGPVGFSFYPEIGLAADNVKLASSAGDFSVSVGNIVAGVRLLSVFSDKIEITGLSLTRPEITIDAAKQKQKAENSPKPDGDEGQDPFAEVVTQLERLSLQNLSITDGKFVSIALNGSRSVVANINVALSAPSLDQQIDLKLDAVKDGQKISLTVSLAALRAILQRQPSRFTMAMKMDPAPHPTLDDLTASGTILLAEDGSYRISDGLFTTLGQPLRLDVLYRPGKRPYGSFRLAAERVDLGAFEKAASLGKNAENTGKTTAKPNVFDVRPLVGFDGDFSVKIDRFIMDNIEVREVDLTAKLKDGGLTINLGNAAIAEGTVAATLASDLNQSIPVVQGSFGATSLKITDLAHLAQVKSPLKGTLGANIGYAFGGLSEAAIKESFNFAGTISIANGSLPVPAPKALGEAAKSITNFNLEAKIQHVQKPIDLKGNMRWNGEAINFGLLITPQKFIKNNAGSLTLSIDSKKFKGDYSGIVNFNGSAKGKVKFSTKSLGNLMAWAGQGKNADLKAFSYLGNINVDAQKFAFNNARISLNGIQVAGSGSVALVGKSSVNASLEVGTLDIGALMGGAKSPGKKKSDAPGAKDTVIDFSALRGFDANIKLKIKKISYGRVTTGQVNTALVVKNGVAHISLPKTAFYGGQVLADIVADGSGTTPSMKIDAKLSKIKALPLFRDAANFMRIEGTINSAMKITGAGKTSKQFAKSLKGTSSARFNDGAIKGIDIAKIYNNIAALLTGGFKENARDKTSFTELGLSFVIDQGVATTSDIKLLGPLVRMDGAGNVDLGSETIDMRLNPLVVVSATGQGGEFDVGGVGIPVIIKGPLSKPRIYPDLKELMKNPQAALNSLSKLGLDLKGLGKGKIDLKKLAAGKLGLDKLGGKGAKGEIAKVIGNLVANDGKIDGGGTEKAIGALIGQLINPDAPKADEGAQPSSDAAGLAVSTGRIATPTPNPRRAAAIAEKPAPAPAPKTATEKIIDQVVPGLKLPGDDETNKKVINNLLEGVFR